MNVLTITRDDANDGIRQFGVAEFLGKEWQTLERPPLDNQNGISCIPVGTYQAEIYQSPTKGSVYLLQNVPGRTMIEIHAANWVDQLAGCISLGLERKPLVNPKTNIAEPAIADSRIAICDFMKLANNETIEVVILCTLPLAA